MKNVYEILEKEGYEIGSELQNYYKNIDKWRMWWKGYVPKFHKYKVTNIKKRQTTVHRNALRMAKKVCEDWANLLLNDKTLINVEDKETLKFLIGDEAEQNGGVFGFNKFWKYGNQVVEKEFALGTTAFVLSLHKPKVLKGQLRGDTVKIKYIKDAKNIIPLSWEDEEVTECAFTSEKVIKGKSYIYLQIMRKENEEYTIENKYYLKDDLGSYSFSDIPTNEVESYKLPVKPFFLLKPNYENNIEDVPLGMSVYANAIDQLKSCDMTFDNFFNDFLLSKKKVFMSEDIIGTTQVTAKGEDGKVIIREEPTVGDAVEQSLFISMGRVRGEDPKMFEDYNPSIRVAENKEGIQLSLNLLSSKVGLGQNRYQFQSNSMNTATEVKASNKDLTESVWKQRISIQDTLVEMTRAILKLGKEKCGANIKDDAKISIQFDDTMFSDEEAERIRDMQEVAQGLLPIWRYKVKWQGMTEKEAKAECGEDDKKGIAFNENSGDDIKETAEDMAGKSLNGAQTQSLMNVISQYSSKTISEGQAINILSTAIGINKEKAKEIINGVV